MRRMLAVGSLLCVLTGSVSIAQEAAPAAQANAADTDITRVREWLDAVHRHQPGQPDDSAFAVAGRSQGHLADALDDTLLLFDRLQNATLRARASGREDVSQVTFYKRAYTREQIIGLLGVTAEEIERRDPSRILRRAAVLHSDVAMLSVQNAALRRIMPPTGRTDIILAADGQSEDVDGSNAHWIIGRRILERLSPTPVNQAMARQWYRAAAAFMHYHRYFGDLKPHLADARRVFPRDPELLFFSGAYHEAMASPAVQSALESFALPQGSKPGVLGAEDELEMAERFLAEAYERDPKLTEAALRRAHVQGVLGRHREAVPLLQHVLQAADDPLIRYYAEMLLGESSRATGNRDAARAAFARAAALFPKAQSPHLALSHLARESGDRTAALEALRGVLARRRPSADEDPWWTYDTAAGRNVSALVAAVYAPLMEDDAR